MRIAANPFPTFHIGKPMTLNPKVTPDVVNKMKYSNYDEFKKFRNQQNLKYTGTKSDEHDDDDCIVIEEKNVVRFLILFFPFLYEKRL